VPTYGLTDNEKTVTVEHVARIAVRNPEMVAAARHYGLTIATCLPADPQAKGGSEASVRIAKADLARPRRTCWATTTASPTWSAPAGTSAGR
jgi:transposase